MTIPLSRSRSWRRPRSGLPWLLGLALALVACSPQLPEGRLRCTTDRDCPSRLLCRVIDEAGERRCVSKGGAAVADASAGLDGATSQPDAAGPQTGGRDAGVYDQRMEAGSAHTSDAGATTQGLPACALGRENLGQCRLQ